MKKILVIVILAVSLIFGGVSMVNADSCSDAIYGLKAQGLIYVQQDKGARFLFVEPLLWKNMTYTQKMGMCICTLKTHGGIEVYIFPMGSKHESEMIGAFNTKKGLRLY